MELPYTDTLGAPGVQRLAIHTTNLSVGRLINFISFIAADNSLKISQLEELRREFLF